MRCASREGNRVGLHFSVTDTGIGIPADKQALIFDAFAQADSSTTRRFGGTGLGLSISRQLAEMMHGRLWVESAAGEGSTFHFTICLDAPDSSSVPAGSVSPKLRDLAVMIVDDNATNRRILEQTLKQWGMRPTLTANGKEALAALEAAANAGYPFPLVLLDVHMPEMDGFSVAERIKKNPRLTSATVLMLSSGSRREDIDRCRELGVAAYLSKPIAQADLKNSLVQALKLSIDERSEQPALMPTASKEKRSYKILLAEDNVVNQKVALRLLEKQGHHAMLAVNGNEVLQLLAKHTFDLVLMDVQMPEMGGFEATGEIRAREALTGRHLPIVAMTAHAMKGDRERCLAAGMDEYLAKPIQGPQLGAKIEEVMARHVAAAPAEPAPIVPPPGELDDSTPFDKDVLLERVEHDMDLLLELTDLFLDDSPRLLAEMRAALLAGDTEALRIAAHTLKGSAGNFEARNTVAAARRVEKAAIDHDLVAAALALKVLGETLMELQTALGDLKLQPA